jgi:hypothetical protein
MVERARPEASVRADLLDHVEGQQMSARDRAVPAIKRKRTAADKPPMPAALQPIAEEAKARHRKRHLNPGVVVEVEKTCERGYIVSSPHRDVDAWQAMICDALGTRSDATAQSFLLQLTSLCSQAWHPSDVDGERGEWVPDERELNLVLNFVAGIKPRNEMEAAMAAQAVAVHLMTMRLSAQALDSGRMAAQDAAVAGKLARTFVMLMDGIARQKGKRSTSRQTITVRQEKHVHHHQHVHVSTGPIESQSQPHETGGTTQPPERASLPCAEQSGSVVLLPRREG